MSEQGWRQFLAAEGVDDWVVLHGGASAVFLVPSIGEEARDHVEERVEAALAAGGRVVDESGAPAHWILSDRAGNRVCICAWPDGAASPAPGDPSAQ